MGVLQHPEHPPGYATDILTPKLESKHLHGFTISAKYYHQCPRDTIFSSYIGWSFNAIYTLPGAKVEENPSYQRRNKLSIHDINCIQTIILWSWEQWTLNWKATTSNKSSIIWIKQPNKMLYKYKKNNWIKLVGMTVLKSTQTKFVGITYHIYYTSLRLLFSFIMIKEYPYW